jgi:hypothetical protein
VALEDSKATGRLKYNNFTRERPLEKLCTQTPIVENGDVGKGRDSIKRSAPKDPFSINRHVG